MSVPSDMVTGIPLYEDIIQRLPPRKKIIIFGNTSNTGWTMAKHLKKLGHSAHLIIPQFTTNCIKLHAHITEVNSAFVNWHDAMKILATQVKKLQPDTILVMFTPEALRILRDELKFKGRLVYLANGSDVREGWPKVIEDYADAIFYSTPDLKDAPDCPEHAIWLPNTPDPDYFKQIYIQQMHLPNKILMKVFDRPGIIDDEKAIEWVKAHSFIAKIDVLHRNESFIPYQDMPDIYKGYGYFLDLKYSPVSEEWLPLSKAAMEFLAMGGMVYNPSYPYPEITELPEEHTYSHVSKLWEKEVFKL